MHDCTYLVLCSKKLPPSKSRILANSNPLINGTDDNSSSRKFTLNLNLFFFIMNKDIIFEIGVMSY